MERYRAKRCRLDQRFIADEHLLRVGVVREGAR